jgi:hypothetical protein
MKGVIETGIRTWARAPILQTVQPQPLAIAIIEQLGSPRRRLESHFCRALHLGPSSLHWHHIFHFDRYIVCGSIGRIGSCTDQRCVVHKTCMAFGVADVQMLQQAMPYSAQVISERTRRNAIEQDDVVYCSNKTKEVILR